MKKEFDQERREKESYCRRNIKQEKQTCHERSEESNMDKTETV